MPREIDHWLIEDDGDYPLPEGEVEDFDCNEFNPKEFEPFNDDHYYETLIP
jgi:hypothetical protein